MQQNSQPAVEKLSVGSACNILLFVITLQNLGVRARRSIISRNVYLTIKFISRAQHHNLIL